MAHTSTPPFAGTSPGFCTCLPEQVRSPVLAKAAEHSPELVVLFAAPRFDIAYANATALRWLDPNRDIDSGLLTLEEVMGLDERQRLHAEIIPHARVLGKWIGECDLRDVWGSEFPVHAVVTVHPHAEPDGPLLVCLQAVRFVPSEGDRSAFGDRELLHALLDSVPDCIYFKDRHSRILRASRAMARKMGLNAPAELIGRTDFDFFSIEHAQRAYEQEQAIARSEEPVVDLEEKETWSDGRITWVSTSKMPLRDREGRVVGTYGISRDITTRKQAEEAHRELEAQLQLAHKLESVGRLASGIAHEINTPTQFITDNAHFLLGALRPMAALIASYRALAAAAASAPGCTEAIAACRTAEEAAEIDYLLSEIPRTLDQSLEGLKRVARIVGSLKEFAHPNNSQRTAADLNRAIENSVTVSRHEWKYVAEVTTQLDPALPPVPCVLDEFNQVMLNLLVNAAHAVSTALKATGRTGEKGRIALRTSHDAAYAVIEVSDTGTGIPKAIQHRIFEPFFTTKEVGKGTGQGLNLIRTIVVKHHGGLIDFTTEEGRGTTFRVRLPLEVPSP